MQLGVGIGPSPFLLSFHARSKRICWKGWVKVWIDIGWSGSLHRGAVVGDQNRLNRDLCWYPYNQ